MNPAPGLVPWFHESGFLFRQSGLNKRIGFWNWFQFWSHETGPKCTTISSAQFVNSRHEIPYSSGWIIVSVSVSVSVTVSVSVSVSVSVGVGVGVGAGLGSGVGGRAVALAGARTRAGAGRRWGRVWGAGPGWGRGLGAGVGAGECECGCGCGCGCGWGWGWGWVSEWRSEGGREGRREGVGGRESLIVLEFKTLGVWEFVCFRCPSTFRLWCQTTEI